MAAGSLFSSISFIVALASLRAPGVRMDAVSSLFATIGYIVVGAGAVGTFVWWLFRTFSEKWLNAKFEARLARLQA